MPLRPPNRFRVRLAPAPSKHFEGVVLLRPPPKAFRGAWCPCTALNRFGGRRPPALLDQFRGARRRPHALVEGLTNARKLAEESRAQPLRNQDISLVSKGDVVTLVYWTDVRCKEGRRLGINHNNTIKALVHAKVVVESFADARVIVHRVPAIMLMRKAREACPLPAWCLSLLEVEQCQQFVGPLDEPPTKCQRCAELKRRGMECTKQDWICTAARAVVAFGTGNVRCD